MELARSHSHSWLGAKIPACWLAESLMSMEMFHVEHKIRVFHVKQLATTKITLLHSQSYWRISCRLELLPLRIRRGASVRPLPQLISALLSRWPNNQRWSSTAIPKATRRVPSASRGTLLVGRFISP